MKFHEGLHPVADLFPCCPFQRLASSLITLSDHGQDLFEDGAPVENAAEGTYESP